MEPKKISFEQLVDCFPDEWAMRVYPSCSEMSLEENNQKKISPEKQQFYLAYYAKMASSHVGFKDFRAENRDKFKAEIEDLCANIKEDRLQGDFLAEMAERTSKYIEDRHFEVNIGRKTLRGGGEPTEATVGKNIFFRKPKPVGYEIINEGWQGEGENRYPTWSIGTMKRGNEDILVVSIPNLSNKNDYDSWKDFIETFDKVYGENKEKWEKGRIILDVRGNRGGEDKPIAHLAARLYGNNVNTYKRCEIADNEVSNFIFHQHGAYKKQNYEALGLQEETLVRRKHFSGENKTLFDETEVYYPFNEEKGYHGKIDILLDRKVGSSAESAYSSFYHHPNTRYIGENTAGMQQYTQGTFNTPWGGKMRVGDTKLTYYDKESENIEVYGHKPDINCSGRDAFDEALELGIDEGRVIGFREKNEEIKGKLVFAEYNPKVSTDTRKAYYATCREQGIAAIEAENFNKELQDKLKGIKSELGTSKKESVIALHQSTMPVYVQKNMRNKDGR